MWTFFSLIIYFTLIWRIFYASSQIVPQLITTVIEDIEKILENKPVRLQHNASVTVLTEDNDNDNENENDENAATESNI